MPIRAIRYHDFSAGHKVTGHESKCKHLHGHNYRVHFTVESKEDLDTIGRVLDFSVIKSNLCEWLEENWDHKFLIWNQDPMAKPLQEIAKESIVMVPFNPTAENMAKNLLEISEDLLPTGIYLTKVVIEETRKCSVEVTKSSY